MALTPTYFGTVIGILPVNTFDSQDKMPNIRADAFKLPHADFHENDTSKHKIVQLFLTTQHINSMISPTRTSAICLTAVSPCLSLYGIVHIVYIIHLKSKL